MKMNLDELSRLGNLADLIQTGFVSKDISNSESLSQLHKWLLDQCSSTYMHHYLKGGLQHWSRKWEYPYILSNIAKYCTSVNVRPHVLDNACGVNATAYLLAKAGLNITGTDLNEQASAEGQLPSEAWNHPDTKNLEGKMSFLKADSLSLPFDNDSFDITFSISSLELMSWLTDKTRRQHSGMYVF